MNTPNTAHGGPVQSAPGIDAPPLSVPGWVVFPPFAGWNDNADDHWPRFVPGETLPDKSKLRTLTDWSSFPAISSGLVLLDGTCFRVECSALVNWNDGMRVISVCPTHNRATAERLDAEGNPADAAADRIGMDTARAVDVLLRPFIRPDAD